MHATKQCLIRWHKRFALTKRFLSWVIHNKNFNTAQINPTNETRFDKTKGRVWNLIQGQQFWIHLTKFDSTTRKRNCQYDIRLAVTKTRFSPWYVATKCNTHQENLILASIPPSYPITLMLHDCITYFFYSNIYNTFKRKNLQSSGNLNWCITWENKKWIKNII